MRALLSFLILLICTCALAQSPTITISTEKIKENGVIKYVHTVKGGETLYSLARAYKVSQEQIIAHNPSLKNGLKEGSKIFIPSSEALSDTSNKTAAVNKKPNSFNTNQAEDKDAQPQKKADRHQWREPKNPKVAKSATAKEVGNTATSAATSAPKAVAAASKATVAQNGAQPAKISKPQRDPDKNYKKHTVRRYEVIDDISAKYNVPIEVLVEFNKLTSTKIVRKQVLYIPDTKYMNEYQAYLSAQKKAAEQAENKQEEQQQPQQQENNTFKEIEIVSAKGGKANVTIILPLNMYSPDNNTSNYMDFYSGALLAAESLKENNYNITINLLDQSRASNIGSIMASPSVKNANFVIGPVMSSSVGTALENKEIIFISPLDSRADKYIASHHNFIQVPASNNTQIQNITELLIKEYNAATDEIVLIYETNGSNAADIKLAKTFLDSAKIIYKTISYNILDSRNVLPKFRSAIKEGKTYKAFVIANSEAFVNDAARNLNLCAQNNLAESTSFSEIILSEDTNVKPIDIVLYGLPKWRNFETIEPFNFHNLNLRLSLPYYVDYSAEQAKKFILKYRALTGTEPTPFAYQGYDITRYFIQMYCKWGADFIKKEKLDHMQMIQSNFNFKKDTPQSGFRNTATTNIVYNKDFSVSILK